MAAQIVVGYKTYIGGMFGLLAAFLVAFKQAVPEHALSLMGIFSVRVKVVLVLVITFFVIFSRVVIPISNSTFNLMVSLHLLPKLSPVLPQTSSGGAGFGGMRPFSPKPLPGSDAAEAERRRAIALRALDMRLNEVALAAAGGGSVPDSVPVAAGPALAAVIAANGSRTASGAATPSRGADAAAENASGGGNAP
ncbi:hypothetical protein HDU82_000601 [Entophlyctis luteolus]|nr:hypothetical protein HDU82_000601 [Entophlyctis luteolus]